MLSNKSWQNKLSPLIRQKQTILNGDTSFRLLLELKDHKTDEIFPIIDGYRGSVYRTMDLLPLIALEISGYSLEELARSPYIQKVWLDTKVYIRLNTAVPTVGANVFHKHNYAGKNIAAAIIDTGIYPHKDFTKPRNRLLVFKDFVANRSKPYDDHGHGTHVAGIIAGNGRASNKHYRGMAPEAGIVAIKALDKHGQGNASDIISSIEWCINNSALYNIKVLNLSLGSLAQESFQMDPICRATSVAWEKGLFICAAAGNDGPTLKTIDSPGINPRIVTVGNINDQATANPQDDELNPSSSRGPTIDNYPKPDLVAPGTNITSTWLNNEYKSLTGTSMATPVVSGAALLILSIWPHLKPPEIKSILKKNSRNLGLSRNLQGAGELNLSELLKKSGNK